MKKAVLYVLATILLVIVVLTIRREARADVVGSGPVVVTAADVTATTCAGASTPVAAASTAVAGSSIAKRICEILTNSGAVSARCGDSSVSTTQGLLVTVNGSITLCVAGAVSCCGVGGSTTINVAEIDRQ